MPNRQWVICSRFPQYPSLIFYYTIIILKSYILQKDLHVKNLTSEFKVRKPFESQINKKHNCLILKNLSLPKTFVCMLLNAKMFRYMLKGRNWDDHMRLPVNKSLWQQEPVELNKNMKLLTWQIWRRQKASTKQARSQFQGKG